MAKATEPLYYERILTIRRTEATTSLDQSEDGKGIDGVRELIETFNWTATGDRHDIDFNIIWFSAGLSGFKAGDRARLVIERLEGDENAQSNRTSSR